MIHPNLFNNAADAAIIALFKLHVFFQRAKTPRFESWEEEQYSPGLACLPLGSYQYKKVKLRCIYCMYFSWIVRGPFHFPWNMTYNHDSTSFHIYSSREPVCMLNNGSFYDRSASNSCYACKLILENVSKKSSKTIDACKTSEVNNTALCLTFVLFSVQWKPGRRNQQWQQWRN